MRKRRGNAPTISWLILAGIAVLLSVPAVASADNSSAPAAAVLSVGAGTVSVPEGNVLGPQPASPGATAPKIDLSRAEYAAAKAAADAAGPSSRPQSPAAASGTLAPPGTLGPNCEGVNNATAGGGRPPDTDAAAGNTHIVTVTNSHIDMYTKSGCPLPAKSVSAASFFTYTAQTLFDPRVIYDETWDRWVITYEAFAESATVQRFFIGVSRTSNPTGSFCFYNIDINSTNDTNYFFDFPQLGHDQDAVLFSANIFSNADTFRFSEIFAVAKARLYNCLGWSVPIFRRTGNITIQPPVVLDQNPNSYYITSRPAGFTGATNLRKFTATNTANAFQMSFSAVPASVPVAAYSIPPSADQPLSADFLDTLDARFQNRSIQTGDSLFQTHAIATGSFATPRWYEIDTEGAGANTIKQTGHFFEAANSDDWNPSIVANAQRDAFVTWSTTVGAGAGTHNARMRMSGRAVTDPAGTIPAGIIIFTSAVPYNPSADTVERWGDYSYVDTDPVGQVFPFCAANERAWGYNEKINSATQWGSRYARLGFC